MGLNRKSTHVQWDYTENWQKHKRKREWSVVLGIFSWHSVWLLTATTGALNTLHATAGFLGSSCGCMLMSFYIYSHTALLWLRTVLFHWFQWLDWADACELFWTHNSYTLVRSALFGETFAILCQRQTMCKLFLSLFSNLTDTYIEQ